MKRLEGWEKRYSHYLMERKLMPFEWGVNDCMQFVAHGVEAITGEVLYPPYSTYNDEKGAKEVLEKNGGVLGIMNTCFGQSHKNYMRASRGDPVIIRNPEIIGGLVSDCGQYVLAVSESGWIKLPLSKAYRIWSI